MEKIKVLYAVFLFCLLLGASASGAVELALPGYGRYAASASLGVCAVLGAWLLVMLGRGGDA